MSESNYRVLCHSSKADIAVMAEKKKIFVTKPEKSFENRLQYQCQLQ
jgi:hypothetical protein